MASILPFPPHRSFANAVSLEVSEVDVVQSLIDIIEQLQKTRIACADCLLELGKGPLTSVGLPDGANVMQTTA